MRRGLEGRRIAILACGFSWAFIIGFVTGGCQRVPDDQSAPASEAGTGGTGGLLTDTGDESTGGAAETGDGDEVVPACCVCSAPEVWACTPMPAEDSNTCLGTWVPDCPAAATPDPADDLTCAVVCA